ncbi:hypothetical protein SCHPADRAFT_764396 [Schizopora paradoxa]|uniref:Uncharacterized protein n=1 Tax=Schizopora paradoxa TaxID=27342 RepID=A0A0H2R3H6_9AGAM|nr:hypothetical protein SCHPADRAFT_764396 [Schizopora paradoxa]
MVVVEGLIGASRRVTAFTSSRSGSWGPCPESPVLACWLAQATSSFCLPLAVLPQCDDCTVLLVYVRINFNFLFK